MVCVDISYMGMSLFHIKKRKPHKKVTKNAMTILHDNEQKTFSLILCVLRIKIKLLRIKSTKIYFIFVHKKLLFKY